MLPCVYRGEEDARGQRGDGRYRRNGSRSDTRSRSRTPSGADSRRRSRSHSRSPRRDRSDRRRSSRSRRSRSNSSEYDRRNRSPRYDRTRIRSRSPPRRDREEFSSAVPYLASLSAQKNDKPGLIFGQPHYKIVLKSLPFDVQREGVIAQVVRQGYRVRDIRIIRKGAERCFGFAEFADVNSAQAWMEFNKGWFTLENGHITKLEYSRYDNLDGRADQLGAHGDWLCAKCTIKNFKNRGSCFKCCLTRIESDALTRKGCAAIGVSKCDTLLLREIPLQCTEAKVQMALARVCPLDILRIHIAESGLYAYVQLRSSVEAEALLLACKKMPFIIDGCAVMVTFSRLPLNTVLSMSVVNDSVQKATMYVNTLPDFRPSVGAGNTGHAGAEAAQLAIAKTNLLRQVANSVMLRGDIPRGAPQPGGGMPVTTTAGGDMRAMGTNFVVTDYMTEEASYSNAMSSGMQPGAQAPFNAQAQSMGTVETPWGILTRYPLPNTLLYQYEASSGLFYDPVSTLYYDNTSQYYWNATSQRWHSWNGAYQTYVPCETQQTSQQQQQLNHNIQQQQQNNTQQQQLQGSNQEGNSKQEQVETTESASEQQLTTSSSTNSSNPAVTEPETPKSAKEIAREMAKWAKKQSKVLLAVKTPKAQDGSTMLSGGLRPKQPGHETTADLTYNLLEKSANPLGSMSDDEEEVQPPPKVAATGICRSALNSTPITQPQSSQAATGQSPAQMVAPSPEDCFIDVEKKSCVLCKRKFGSLDVLNKHVRLSDLHKRNVEEYRRKNAQTAAVEAASTDSPQSNVETSASLSARKAMQQYRDRAKERRNMFGLDPSGFTGEPGETAEATMDYSVRTNDTPLDETNIGNKLLKSMGWTEGSGIGKNNQGIVAPIAAERRVEGAGLGAAGSRVLHGANATRRERARSAMISRYNELN